MTSYVSRFRDGDKDQKDLLGGKGANLAEMTNLDLPVPPGFTITTEACRAYMRDGHVPPELRVEVTLAVREIEDTIGRRLGDFHEPLLVSVRSGAKFSMPGMMETVLNIGLNDASVKGLTEFSGDERFAWDSYRRLIQMFGKTVLGIDGDLFAAALDERKTAVGAATDVDLSAQDLRVLVQTFKEIVVEQTGREFPQHPREQLDMAIEAVLDSWNTDRARLYRRRERIPNDLGTAVNVVSMVFGNLGETSGTGVCFTRDPSTGETGVYGDYLPERAGRGRRRGDPQHPAAGRAGGARPGLVRRAAARDAPAGDALPRPVRHRVHHRARQALAAADPGGQADRGGRVPDRDRARRREPHHDGRGDHALHGRQAQPAAVPAVRRGAPPGSC